LLLPAGQPDFTTETGRGNERNRRAALTSVAGIGSRVLSVAVSLITIPILLHYLGIQRFGIWLTVSAGATWLGLLQLGLGPSLLNRLSAIGRTDDRAQRLVSTAWWLSILLGAAGLLPLVLLYAFASWSQIFNVAPGELATEARTLTATVWLTVAAGLPLSIPAMVLRARQEGYLANIFDVAATAARLLVLLVLVRIDAGMTGLAVGFAVMGIGIGVAAAALVFGIRNPGLRPSRTLFDRSQARSLLGEGVAFTGLGIAALVIMSADAIVITQVLGPAAVPPYAVPFSILTLFFGFELAMLDAVWPAYSESAARGDTGWLQSTHRALTRTLLLGSLIFGVLLVVVGPGALMLWAGPEIVPPMAVLVVFAIIAIVQAYEIPLGRILLALGHVRRYTLLGFLNAAVNLPVSIVLAPRIGITGVAIGTLAGYLVSGPFLLVWARRRLSQLKDGDGEVPAAGPSATRSLT
jgi:O-antigen/teichoic acid export membrane protein